MVRVAQRCCRTSNVTSRFYVRKANGKLDYIAPPTSDIVKCGEIWMCELPENSGSVQSGLRPVLVISNDKNNEHSPILNIIPMTTKINKRNLPCHVVLEDFKQYGLLETTTIMVEQTTSINKSCLRFKIGKIDDAETLIRICVAMKIQFPMLNI